MGSEAPKRMTENKKILKNS